MGQQREALILEPFVAVAPMVEARSATQFDRASGLSCALTFAVPLALLVGAAATSSGGPQSALLKASLGAFAAGVVVTTVLLIAGPGRYVRHSVLPMLAHALHPLKPTERELSAALDRMSSLGLKVGRIVKPEQILSALAKFDDGQFRHPSVT